MSTEQHEAGAFYWEAGSDECPHGPEPDYDTQPEAWDTWYERHTGSPQDVRICLDAPAGNACLQCTDDDGEMVPWEACRVREHARPKRGVVPSPGADHQPVTVLVGTLECLDRECDEYFGDDGDEIPGMEACSHIREEESCACRRKDNGEYADGPCSALSVSPVGGATS